MNADHKKNFLRHLGGSVLGITNMRAIQAWRRSRAESKDINLIARQKLYEHFIQKGELVFDIGANIGNRTRVFADLGARVIAVEPQAHCVRALRLQFLFRPNVTICHSAAGPDCTPRTLDEFETDVLSSMSAEWIASAKTSGRFGNLKLVRKIEVPCVSIDELIAHHGVPAFVKIDVEGYEPEVLAGLSRTAGTISFEITAGCLAATESCLVRLERLGYRRFLISAGESMQLSHDWMTPDAIREALVRFESDPAGFGDLYARSPSLP
jgi:FkbM family methyltransferase